MAKHVFEAKWEKGFWRPRLEFDRTVQTWYKRLLECKKDKSKTRKDLDKMIALFTYTSADMLVAYFLKKAQSGEGGNDGKEISALLKQHSVSLCH